MPVCPHCGEDVADDEAHYDDETRETWHSWCLALFVCDRCGYRSLQIPIHDAETIPCVCGATMRIR